MRRFGLIPALLVAAGVLRPAQQQTSGDQGRFAITQAGVPIGTESFTITRQAGPDGGTYTLHGTRSVPGRASTQTALITDSSGGPLSYDRRSPGDTVFRISATRNAGRLTVYAIGTGFHSYKDYLLRPGTLVLDDDLVHQLHLVFLTDLARSITYISPAAAAVGAASLVDEGQEEVILGNKARIQSRHFAFGTGAAARDIWIDSNKRVLKVSIPGRMIEALRDEPPR
jgi:hypothetical protein